MMKMAVRIASLVLLVAAGFCAGQEGCESNNRTCDACISFSGDCVWCSLQPNEIGSGDNRCRNGSMPGGRTCSRELVDPLSSFEITQNDTLDSDTEVTPQALRLELRRGVTKTFQIDVQPAPNAPFDVYFLMDLSASLLRDLTQLRNLTSAIADSLSRNSESFAMGFGSFVDKPTRPYALSSYRQSNSDNCINNMPSGRCEETYSFRHVLSLTSDVQEFSTVLENVTISASVDNPEGGLDALLQTAVCPEIIGWRSDSVLRMLIFITDAGYHIAGDGIFGGIVRPNDGRCHMELIGENYEHVLSTVFDYPSIYQLNELLVQENIIPIFAVDGSRIPGYEFFREYTAPPHVHPTSRYVITLDEFYQAFHYISTASDKTFGQLARDLSATRARAEIRERGSTNLIRIIENSYNASRQTVRVIPEVIPGLSFSVTPLPGCTVTEENACAGVQFEQTVSFDVSVTLEDCELFNSPMDVAIRVPGFGTTILTVEPVCTCNCSTETATNDPLCNGNGTLVCGSCVCNPGRSGQSCQCDNNQRPEQCPASVLGEVCFDRGTCNECNMCDCDPEPGTNTTYFGDACQCDSNTCLRNTVQGPFFNLPCSGQGECICETQECRCYVPPNSMSGLPFFDSPGQPCACDPDDCYNAQFDGLCVNVGGGVNGTCTCSGCQCPDPGILTAVNGTCTPVPSVCSGNEPCARCAKSGMSTTDCGCDFTVLLANTGVPSIYVVMCSFVDAQGCTNVFHVAPDSPNQPILVEDQITCPTSNTGWIVAVSIVGAILLLGLLALIIIKLILLILDRTEYKKFTKQLQEADWAPHDNPLYVNPQQDYRNVAYKKR